MLISSSKIFAQSSIPSHGTNGLKQGRTLGHCAEGTPSTTGTMPALSSRSTGGVSLWHFPVSKVDCSSVPMPDNALCRLLIFIFCPCRHQKLWFGWIEKEAVNMEEITAVVWRAASSIEPQLAQFSPLDTWKLLKMCHLLPGVARSLQGVARLLSGCGRNTSCGTAHHMTHRSELKYQMLLLEGEHSSICVPS